MREIAAEADFSLGLAYRYFAIKEELVIELYRNLVRQLEEQAKLALTLFWLQDLGPGAQKTYEFVAFMRDMLVLIRPLMRLADVSKALARLARIAGPMSGDPKEAQDNGRCRQIIEWPDVPLRESTNTDEASV